MNKDLEHRIAGIQKVLLAAFDGGVRMANANKGIERETFVSLFLRQVLPPLYRVGTGEVVDRNGSVSGQLDVVVEMPWAPSFPLSVEHGPRLYPAEAVGAAIEVKSDAKAQWDGEVDRTAGKLAPLRQELSGTSATETGLRLHPKEAQPIPLFVVGFEGWKKSSPIEERLAGARVDGVLILRSLVYVETDRIALCLRRRRWEQLRTQAPLSVFGACCRILELQEAGSNAAAIADDLNRGRFEAITGGDNGGDVGYGDEIVVPKVSVGEWTEELVDKFVELVGLQVDRSNGPEAMLRFIAALHKQVGKRAAMSFDLTRYA